MHSTRIDLPLQSRKRICDLLNARLADLINLHSQVKQAHWTVRGPSFIALHEMLDQAAAELTPEIDEMAERITALGGTPLGTARHVAKASKLEDFPTDITSGPDHVAAIADRYAAMAKRVRQAIEEAAEAEDAGSEDLLTGLSRLIDKRLWLIEAHAQAKA